MVVELCHVLFVLTEFVCASHERDTQVVHDEGAHEDAREEENGLVDVGFSLARICEITLPEPHLVHELPT